MIDVALGAIVAELGGELVGEAGLRIRRLGTLAAATPDTLSFLANPRYASQLAGSGAGCVIVAPAQREVAAAPGAAILTPAPYLY